MYVQFVDSRTKKCLPALSTRKTNRDEALLVVYEWLQNGIPQKRKGEKGVRSVQEKLSLAQILYGLKTVSLKHEDILKIEKILQDQGLIVKIIQKSSASPTIFIDFLLEFWDYDKSPYIKEKLALKSRMGRGRANIMTARVKKYWAPYFKNMLLEEVGRTQIREFSKYLFSEHSNLSPSTLQAVFFSGIQALRWAYANEYIMEDVTKYRPSFSAKHKERGVLSPEEATKLFSMEWPTEQGFLINLVAMTTGLRLGEILALRMEDIGEKYITVENSYSDTDGLKSTKTDTVRTVPVIPSLRDALRAAYGQNPYKNGFIFYGTDPGRPISRFVPENNLKAMLVKMKMTEDADDPTDKEAKKKAREYWKKRNVVFHSWRHFYASRMVDKIEARKVMLATGHKTEEIFKVYTDHKLENDLIEVAATTNEVFGPLIPEITTDKG
jgi:integrase